MKDQDIFTLALEFPQCSALAIDIVLPGDDLATLGVHWVHSAVCALRQWEWVTLLFISFQTIAKRLLESKQTIPHYYLSVDIEVDQIIK